MAGGGPRRPRPLVPLLAPLRVRHGCEEEQGPVHRDIQAAHDRREEQDHQGRGRGFLKTNMKILYTRVVNTISKTV